MNENATLKVILLFSHAYYQLYRVLSSLILYRIFMPLIAMVEMEERDWK